jgi:hypothetical protein
MHWDAECGREERPEGAVDLGPDHFYTKSVDREEKWVGILEWHWNPTTGRWCGGWVPFNVPSESLTGRGPMWDVHSYDPLHIEPSLQCGMCSNHGWIRDGKWVEA